VTVSRPRATFKQAWNSDRVVTHFSARSTWGEKRHGVKVTWLGSNDTDVRTFHLLSREFFWTGVISFFFRNSDFVSCFIDASSHYWSQMNKPDLLCSNINGYLLCMNNNYSHSHLVTPSPTNPGKHVHAKLPGVFVHWASWWQGKVTLPHSLMSLHVVPFPKKPALQTHLCKKTCRYNMAFKNVVKQNPGSFIYWYNQSTVELV